MNEKKLAALAFCALLAAAPAMAQHGDMHDHGSGHGGAGGHMEMSGMHGEQMMDHMSSVLDQMSDMMQQMQAAGAELPAHDHQDLHAGVMHEMSGDMSRMMQAMDSMLQHLRTYAGDESVRNDPAAVESMNGMVEHLDRMLQAGRGMMALMNGPGNQGHDEVSDGHGH